ncbi:MAG: hypothetical protein ACI8PB_005305 [Desulforhopalus sp.]|jgi:hypothetical protein
MDQQIDQKWKEYEHLTSLYSIYLQIIIKLGIFSYGIIGGITTYSLKLDKASILNLSILFPIVLSLGVCFIYLRSIKPANELKDAIAHLG